jgi:hypothetical protein
VHQAPDIYECKKAPRHQAANLIEQKLQGIKPPTWMSMHGLNILQLKNIMNILKDSNNWDKFLQLHNLDRHLQITTLMVNNSKNSNMSSIWQH